MAKPETDSTQLALQPARVAHGPWSNLALHTIGWRAFQDLCSQVCEVFFERPVEIYREAQDGGQDAVFLIPSKTSEVPAIRTIQCKHSSDPTRKVKLSDLIGTGRALVNAGFVTVEDLSSPRTRVGEHSKGRSKKPRNYLPSDETEGAYTSEQEPSAPALEWVYLRKPATFKGRIVCAAAPGIYSKPVVRRCS
jgi:hypothetical protein